MTTKSDFMAAEEIKSILHGREKSEQERIIRWVAESLGLATTAPDPEKLASPHPNAPQPPPPHGQPLPHGASGHRKDIKSFVNEKKPKSDLQFVAVVGYFFRFEAPQADRKEIIVAQDLQDAGRQARGYGFKSPLVTLNNAVAQGYFDRGGRGEFKLNAVGENLVAMTLPGGDTGQNHSARPKKRKAAKNRNQRAKKSKAS